MSGFTSQLKPHLQPKQTPRWAEKGAHVPWKWRLLHSSWPQMKHCETSTSSHATLIRGSSVAFPCLKNFQLPTESPHGTRSICSKPGEKGVAQHNTGIDSLTVWHGPMDCLIDVQCVAQVIFAKIWDLSDLKSSLRLRRCLKKPPSTQSILWPGGPACLIQRYTAKHHIQITMTCDGMRYDNHNAAEEIWGGGDSYDYIWLMVFQDTMGQISHLYRLVTFRIHDASDSVPDFSASGQLVWPTAHQNQDISDMEWIWVNSLPLTGTCTKRRCCQHF